MHSVTKYGQGVIILVPGEKVLERHYRLRPSGKELPEHGVIKNKLKFVAPKHS